MHFNIMGTIKQIWDKVQEELDDFKKTRQLRNLKLQADISVKNDLLAKEKAEEKLQTIILKQKTKEEPSFDEIVKAKEELDVAILKHKRSCDLYKEFFDAECDFK
jgi:hypothetical protein